jgi:hypothetical protein
MTLYKVAKLLNTELTAKGFKTVPTQMLYNYARNHLIPTHAVNGQQLVTEDNAKKFVAKFVSNRAAKK